VALAVPLVTCFNYVFEDLFARHWGSRWERWRGREAGAIPRRLRAAPEEAGA